MTANRGFVREQQAQMLLDSIRDQRQLMVTVSAAGGWRTFKGSFSAGTPEAGELRVRLMRSQDHPSAAFPAAGDHIGATFRLGHKKCMFATVVRDSRPQGNSASLNPASSGSDVELVLGWPEQTQQLQRRAYERATPPSDTIIAVRFWHEGEENGGAAPLSPASPGGEVRVVRHGQLEDISCGGVRVRVPDPTDIVIGATYKCVFTPRPGKPALVLDGILRHREAVEKGRASLGFQFVGLETSAERLRMLDRLARLVRHFQRGHRPPKSGVAGGASRHSRPRSFAGSEP